MWTINQFLNSAFDLIYAPMSSWPAWLSLGIISAVTGIVLLIAYRYTSNQDAIGRVRDEIKANMLAMKLYKDSLLVAMDAQFRVIWASIKILLLSIPPLLVALIPVGGLFVQMTGRYQFTPIQPGQSATIQAFFSDEFADLEMRGESSIELSVPDGVELLTPSPFRQNDSKIAYWQVRADQSGLYALSITAGDQTVIKQFPVGDIHGNIDGYDGPISPLLTRYSFLEMVGFPWEAHPSTDSHFRAIGIPESINVPMPDVLPIPILGNWIIYFLVVSMVFALIFKPILKVRI